MNIEEAKRKIKKAMTLANDSGATAEESHTAMLMAQRIMAKYKIEGGEVGQDDFIDNEVIEIVLVKSKRMQYWKKYIASIISSNFRCYAYTRTSREKETSLLLLALKNDAILAKEMFDFAVTSLEYSLQSHIQLKKQSQDKLSIIEEKNSYIMGFIMGMKQKFSQQVEELELAPMLVKDEKLVEHMDGLNLRKGKSPTIKLDKNSSSFHKGYERGNSFSSQKRLS